MESRLKERGFTLGRFRLCYSDIAAFVVFIAVFAFFIFNARYGSNEADETLYQVVCYRLSRGDKLFADDWMFITNAYFLYVPYRLACLVCGGTEGIILFLRYFYVVVKMLFFIYIYLSLRVYGFWAVFSAAVYCGTDLFGMKTMDFYSICANAVLIASIVIFIRKNVRPLQLVFAGFVFSCAVIVQPGVAFVWFLYSIATLIASVSEKKEKRFLNEYSFVFSGRVWMYLFLGVASAAVVFFILSAVFFTGTDLNAIALGFRELTNLLGRRTAEGYSFAWIRLNKPVMYAIMYNPVLSVMFILLFTLTLILPRRFQKLGKPLFTGLFVLFICMSVHLILYPVESTGNTVGESCSHPLLLALMGIPAYSLTKNKNRRLFAFLMFSAAVSLFVDIFSNNTFGSVLLVGDVPAILLLRNYLEENVITLKDRSKGKTKKSPYPAILCSFIAFLVIFEGCHYAYMTTLPALEARLSGSYEPLDTVVESGVYKGVVTTGELSDYCEKTYRDAKRIGKMCERGLYVADYDVTAYLSADSDVCSPWAQVFQNWEGEEIWWETHKRPDVVYIPFSALSYSDDVAPADERLSYFLSAGEFSVERGENGYILKSLN